MKHNLLKSWSGKLVLAGLILSPMLDTAANPDKDKEKGNDKKVTICHKGQTLELPEAAVQAHLNHGDTLGPCSVTPSQNR
jgi:hypothetical protein